MNQSCHRRERAEYFRRNNYVSHIPKGRLRADEATVCINKLESFFHKMASCNSGISMGTKFCFKLREGRQELQVEMSGNSQEGSLVLHNGLSLYSEIHYTPRAIHVYRSENEGSLAHESAVYLHRKLPSESLSYGSKSQLQRLLDNL